ncbi:hypothetical protein NDU88_005535 [Pleurodeles waltl]|uniref:Uncharacterized protein n=1 Tax=Pleurodeles waltl TaxID=8319 RepID=A0AAV7SM01_PLEWA|nr:hypothetical protein NDU88_005535 [Pleurodeles waltl]
MVGPNDIAQEAYFTLESLYNAACGAVAYQDTFIEETQAGTCRKPNGHLELSNLESDFATLRTKKET